MSTSAESQKVPSASSAPGGATGTTGTKEIELSAGTVAYEDTGGDGPTVVLLHGLMMDASLWGGTVAGLSAGYRCLAPTLPLGAHPHPMRADADLSLRGTARLVGELLDRLDLHDVTLVGSDTGGALVQLLIAEGAVAAPRGWGGSCSSPARRSTTTRPG